MTTATTLMSPAPAETIGDRIRHVKLSTLTLPLDTPISDAKVLTGRQKPMTEIVFLFVAIDTEHDQHAWAVLAQPHHLGDRHRLAVFQLG